MKKSKNETAANRKADAAAKQEKITVNDPSEKIRSKEAETAGFSFKKVLYGYDPNEVASYIKELTDNNEASARNYEQKLSSIKEELAFSNRERDSYGEKYRECKARLDKASEAVPQKNGSGNIADEYKKIIDSLNDRLEQAEAENEKLRSMPVQNPADIYGEYEEKIAFLEKENGEIRAKAETLQRKNEELLAAEQKYESLLAEHNAFVSRYERLRAENEAKEKAVSELKAEITEKAEEIGRLSLANDESKKTLAGLEAENGVLQQCVSENEDEILRLKETNKAQAHEYADKINRLESDRAASALAMQKEIKLRDYYINQAKSTLSELSEQMEQIRKTFTDTQSV